MSTIDVDIVTDPDGSEFMTIKRYNVPLLRIPLPACMDETMARKVFEGDVKKDALDRLSAMTDTITQFIITCFGSAQNITVTNMISQFETNVNGANPDPIKFNIPSKTSTVGDLVATQVLNGIYRQFYDSGAKKVFIGDPPSLVGTAGSILDSASKGEIDEFWPETNTTINFSEAFCKRVGLPNTFKISTKTIDDGNTSETPSAEVTFYFNGTDYREIITKDVNSATGNNMISKYAVGNKEKNNAIMSGNTTLKEKNLYLLVKELGDYLQVLLFIIASKCYEQDQQIAQPPGAPPAPPPGAPPAPPPGAATTFVGGTLPSDVDGAPIGDGATMVDADPPKEILPSVLTTTDYIVYLRLRAFLQHVLYTGVRAGVKSGGATYWYNCPKPLSYDNIIAQIKNYNKNLYFDILKHNITTLNYLCKIRFGLHKLKKRGKYDKEIKTHKKQAERILRNFSLIMQDKGRIKKPTVKFGSAPVSETPRHKKISLSIFVNGCSFIGYVIDDTNNDYVLRCIIENINGIIEDIIDKTIDLMLLNMYYSKLLENCSAGANFLPCLDTEISATIISSEELKTTLKKIFTNITKSLDSNEFENFFNIDTILNAIDEKIATPEEAEEVEDVEVPIEPDAEVEEVSKEEVEEVSKEEVEEVSKEEEDEEDEEVLEEITKILKDNCDKSNSDDILNKQVAGINKLLKHIETLRKYESNRIIAILNSRQFHLIDPKFLIIQNEKYKRYRLGKKKDIIDDKLLDVYTFLRSELKSKSVYSASGGRASQVTKKHLKSRAQGKHNNNNTKNVTKKRRKMTKLRNEVITGGAREKRKGSEYGLRNIAQKPNNRMNTDDVEMSDMKQEELFWYIAKQISSNLQDKITIEIEDIEDIETEMTRLVYETLVARNLSITRILNTFNILPYYENEVLYYKNEAPSYAEAIFIQEAIPRICEKLPQDEEVIMEVDATEDTSDIVGQLERSVSEDEDEEVIMEVDANTEYTSGFARLPPLRRSDTIVSTGSIDSQSTQVNARAKVKTSTGLPSGSGLVPIKLPTLPTIMDKGEGILMIVGGYCGINKRKNKSCKNKKHRHKTRHKTRRKHKKIKTRKNKQVRRKQ